MRPYSYLVAFMGGFNIMLLEMCAFRVLQTNFGSSIYVTGGLLALIMIALSIGYHLGGRFSRRAGASLRFLHGSMLAALLYVHVVHLWLGAPLIDALFELRSSFEDPQLKSAIPSSLAVVALYLLPMVALAVISPYLVGQLARREESGSETRAGPIAGNLMATSTVGSIVGTILPSYVLIPRLGIDTTLLLFEGSLLALIAGGALLSLWSRRTSAVTVTAGALLLLFPGQPSQAADVVYQGESMYGAVQIVRSTDADGNEMLIYKPSRLYTHSVVVPDKPAGSQYAWAQAIPGLVADADDILVLGTGLGEIPALLATVSPHARITAVEIDPVVVELATRYVPALSRPQVELLVDDARTFLRATDRQYDYIMVDLFSGEQPPLHCITREFFSLVRAHMTDDGALFVNTNMPDFYAGTGFEPERSRPIRHLHAAIRAAGFPSLFSHELHTNGFLYGYPREVPLDEVRRRFTDSARATDRSTSFRVAAALAAAATIPVPNRDARPFTDAWVPEHVIERKENDYQLVGALREARQDPRWAPFFDAAPDDPHHLVTEFLARWGRVVASDAFEAHIAGRQGSELCRQFVAWIDGSSGDVSEQLAKYVLRADFLPACAEHYAAAESDAWFSSRRTRVFRAFVGAAAAGLDDRADGLDALLAGLLEFYSAPT